LRLLVALGALAMAGPAHAAPISAHAMVHTCCMESSVKEGIFGEASELGAAYIRVDVELDPIFEKPGGAERPTPSWARLDEVVELSRRYAQPVVAILLAPRSDASEFGARAGLVAEHVRGAIDHWEILNEPDADWAFDGTAEDYAGMLSAAYDAIKARAPAARVVLGGVQRPDRLGWLERVFATPGADTLHKFDVANLHLRGPVEPVVRRYGEFRSWLAERGFHGPAWVTEHGYPADPAFQFDPAYAGGDASQAAYLTQSLVGLGEAGAEQVFVTLRDNLEGQYASEGLVHIDEATGNTVYRRPAFAAVRRLVNDWGQVMSWRQEQRENERLLPLDQADLADKVQKTRAARAEFREARLVVDAAEQALAAPQASTKARRERLVRRLTLRLERARGLLAGRRMMLLWDSAITRWQRKRNYERAATIYMLKQKIAGG